MARVASNQSLGVLVIDEIQNLSEAKSGGHRKMLNFFVQLINTIGLPVVLVGTYKAMSVLGSEFRQMRRGTGQGDLVWDPMAEDEVWQFFVESLWRYQYVRQPCPLTSELSHALYYETQGITDFAVKVYMLAQIRAITTLREKVTKAIIQSVAKDSRRLATPVLSALKSGNLKKLQDYENVHPIDIELFLAEATEDRSETKLRSGRNDLVQEATAQSQPSSGDSKATFEETNPNAVSNTASAQVTNRSKQRRLNTCASFELPEIVSRGASKGLSAYEAIRQAGYIRPATEFLDTRSRG
jgi:hypothetical protein